MCRFVGQRRKMCWVIACERGKHLGLAYSDRFAKLRHISHGVSNSRDINFGLGRWTAAFLNGVPN